MTTLFSTSTQTQTSTPSRPV